MSTMLSGPRCDGVVQLPPTLLHSDKPFFETPPHAAKNAPRREHLGMSSLHDAARGCRAARKAVLVLHEVHVQQRGYHTKSSSALAEVPRMLSSTCAALNVVHPCSKPPNDHACRIALSLFTMFHSIPPAIRAEYLASTSHIVADSPTRRMWR